MRARVARLRSKGWAIGQCAVAAGVAWWLAADVLGHRLPFFAPIAAVIALGTSYGQRHRRVVEIAIGVAVGVFLGDLVTHLLGSGAWQIALIVAVGMSLIMLLFDAGPLLVNQAAVQGIVVSALAPPPGGAFLRWSDALIGGGVALVAATVVPRAPLRRPRDQAGVVVRKIAALLRSAADRLERRRRRPCPRRRCAKPGPPTCSSPSCAPPRRRACRWSSASPFRRGHGEHQRQLAELVEPLDVALRNTRVVVRRVAVACHRREPVPASYAALMRDLAGLAERVADELVADRMAFAIIDDLVALGRATATVESSDDLSAEVILAQVRSIIADLLALCGMDPLEATDVDPAPLTSDTPVGGGGATFRGGRAWVDHRPPARRGPTRPSAVVEPHPGTIECGWTTSHGGQSAVRPPTRRRRAGCPCPCARRSRRSSRGAPGSRRAPSGCRGWRRPRAARGRSGPWSPC